MKKISLKQARQLAIHQQGLYAKTSNKGKSGLLQVIEQIGYVQIDTISVIARAHHHILWNRVHRYDPAWLSRLEEDRSVFEYWAHAASYLPMKDFRYSLIMKESFRNETASMLRYFKKDPKRKAYVLDRIKAEGPLMSKDFKNTEKPKKPSNGMDWTRNPFNVALRLLFMEGRIMVAHRKGFQKAYDLTERVLPSFVDPSLPSREEFIRHLILRDIHAHGLVRPTEIGYLLSGTNKDIETILKKMLSEGDILEMQVEKLGPKPYYTTGRLYDELENLKNRRTLTILSPFDNLIIQRKRAEELFDFKYILECYVPAAKRKFGYFCLPILKGHQLLGQIDLKADRKTKVLYIQNLIWEQKIKNPDRYEADLQRSLLNFAAFNDCEKVL